MATTPGVISPRQLAVLPTATPAIEQAVWERFAAIPSVTLPKKHVKPIRRITAPATALYKDHPVDDVVNRAHKHLHAVLDGRAVKYKEKVARARDDMLTMEGEEVRGRVGGAVSYKAFSVSADPTCHRGLLPDGHTRSQPGSVLVLRGPPWSDRKPPIFQEAMRAWQAAGKEFEIAEVLDAAAATQPLRSIIDPDSAELLSPGDLPARIAAWCPRTGSPSQGRHLRSSAASWTTWSWPIAEPSVGR